MAYALDLLEISYNFVSRQPSEGFFTYHDLDDLVFHDHPIIINTTPLGTFPKVDMAPVLPYQFISNKHLVFDLIYNPAQTKFMKLAEENGAKTCNGLQMLELQAERAWDIWNS